MGIRRVFISFKNDDGVETSGYFDLVEETANYVKIKSGSNILTIPFHRINKIKESLQ